MSRLLASLGLALALTGLTACDTGVVDSGPAPRAPQPQPQQIASTPGGTLGPRQAQRAFVAVKARVEPVAERECRARTRNMNCDFRILVDDRPGQQPNAFQTLDKNGRPLLVFTQSLLEGARNADEIAFVMGHEAAHHIQGHLMRAQQNAASVAVIFAGLATLSGGDPNVIEEAANIGGFVGARSYSKEYELEADQLGTILTLKSGFDPVRGAAYFTRIPDPGNRFLGTHPPNAQRIDIVRRTAARF